MGTEKLSAADISFMFGAAPEEAVAYLEKKGLRLSWNWHETLDAAHARSFTVAKVAKIDVLRELKRELQNTLKNGGTEKQFIEKLTPELQRLGWWGKQIIVDSQGGAEVVQMGSPRRLKTIFRTNLQSAYMAGRYKTLMEGAATHPYWKYVAILDGKTRAAHRALDGRVFSLNDGFTEIGLPPNGYNCRCRHVPMSEFRLKREGITPTDTSGQLQTRYVEAGIDKRTGEVTEAEQTGFFLKGSDGRKQWVGPDVGFNSSPLASHIMDDVLIKRAASLSPDAISKARELVLSQPRMDAWNSFVQNTIEFGRQQNQTMTIGVMRETELSFAKAKGAKIESPVIFLSDKLISSPKSRRHFAEGDALSVMEWLALPESLAKAEMAVWDTEEKTLVYLLPGQDGNSRLAIRFGRLKQDGTSLPDAATVFKTPKSIFDDFLRLGRYERIW